MSNEIAKDIRELNKWLKVDICCPDIYLVTYSEGEEQLQRRHLSPVPVLNMRMLLEKEINEM